MISSIKWIKKGVAAEIPIVKQMDEEEFSSIKNKLGMMYEDIQEEEQTIIDDDKYNLKDYDKPSNRLFTMQEDEIDYNYEVDEEELEELRIEPSDNLVIVGKTEDDISQLEIYVYEEDNLYVHHDIMLSSFPLCLEWIGNNGNFCAVGTFDPHIEIWNLDLYQPIFPDLILGEIPKTTLGPTKKKHGPARVSKKIQPTRHVDAVMALSWNQKFPNLLLSGSADCTVKLWDLTRTNAVFSYEHHSDKVQSVEWNNIEPTVFATGGYDQLVAALDTRSTNQILKLKVDGDVESIRWDPFQSHILYASTEKGLVYSFDMKMRQQLFCLHAHDSACTVDVNRFFEGLIVTGSSDKSVKLWNIKEEPRMTAKKDVDGGKIFGIEFSPDDELMLAIGGSAGKVVLWDAGQVNSVKRDFKPKQTQNKEIIVVEEEEEDSDGISEPSEEEMDEDEDEDHV